MVTIDFTAIVEGVGGGKFLNSGKTETEIFCLVALEKSWLARISDVSAV